MFQFSKIRRRLLLGAGSLLVLSGTTLMVAHTGLVRRFVLVQAQIRLGNALGVVIDAKSLDYNLLASRFELRDLVVIGAGTSPMRAPLRIQRIELVVPVWRLFRGSLDSARVRLDGLSVLWFTSRDGQTNWPSVRLPGVGGGGGGPAVSITNASFRLLDDRSALAVQLTVPQLSGEWDAANSRYAIAGHGSAGTIQWNGSSVPVDGVELTAAVQSGVVRIDSLRIQSRTSVARITGSVSGSPPHIDATADVDADLHELSQAQGRLQARVSATGLLDALHVNGTLRGVNLAAGGVVLQGPEADASFDMAAEEVRIQRLSAGVWGGNLTGSGRLVLGPDGGRSEFKGSLSGLELPPGKTALEFAAFWPGLAFDRATVSGVARAQSASIGFNIAGTGASLRAVLDARLAGGVSARGTIGFGLDGHALTGTLHGTIDSLAQLGNRIHLPPVDGIVRFSTALGGTVEAPTVSLQLDADQLAAFGWTGGTAHVQARYARTRIAVANARLAWNGQQIEAQGEIGGISKDSPVALNASIHGHAMAGVEGAISGSLSVSGNLSDPVADMTLHAPFLTAFGETFVRAGLDARWQHGILALTRLSADQEPDSSGPGRVDASGWLEAGTGRYELQIGGRDLRAEAVALAGGRRLTGTFQFATHGKGTLSDPVFSTSVDGSGVKVGEVEIGSIQGKVDTSGRQGIWTATLQARNESFDAAMRGNGTLAPFAVEHASADVNRLRIVAQGQEIAGDGPIRLSYAGDRIRVDQFDIKSGASALHIAGELPLRDDQAAGSVSLVGKVDLAPISNSLMSGTAEVNATVTGSLQTWQPSGSATIQDARVQGPIAIDEVKGRLHLEDGVIQIEDVEGSTAHGKVRVQASLPLRFLNDAAPSPSRNPGAPAHFSAEMDRLELSAGTGDQLVTAGIGAKIEGEASSFSLSAVRAGIEFSHLEVRTPTRFLQQTGPTRITVDEGVAHVERFEIASGEASLHVGGSLGLTASSPLQIEAAGKTDLALFSVLAPEIESDGSVELDLRVGGTLEAPKTTGFVKLEKAGLVLRNPRIRAANVNMYAEIQQEQVRVKELSGYLNGGAFKGGGEFKIGTDGLRDVNLFVKAKDCFSEYPISVKTVSSVDVNLVSRGNRLVLTGQFEVQEGYHESAIDLFSRSGESFDIGEEVPKSESNAIALDINVKTRRPVEMDNNLGRLSATADLRLAGTVIKPVLLGRLDLEQDGKLYFGDRTYYIESGIIRFENESEITPTVNVQAYTRTGDYTIKLGLTGTLDDLTTTFTSDPPLSRDDVIAVLLTGKTVAENRGVDLRAMEATALATGALNASLSSGLHRTLGISRVSIQPGAVAAESNPGARITVTQDFTSSLRLLYSMNLSDSNDQIWVGEYDVSRRFTTRAVKQSDNTYRGEFRHDIRFGNSSATPGKPQVRQVVRKLSEVRFEGTTPFRPEELAKIFKVKAGQKYKAIKTRQASQRMTNFLMKKRYLESRVRLDREDDGQDLRLTVRIETGPQVELAFHGAQISNRQKSRVRKVWHAGISDQQRPQAAREAMLGYFAEKGFLRAESDVRISTQSGHKIVEIGMQPGSRYHGVKTLVEGAAPDRAREIVALLDNRPMKLALYRDPARVAEAITRYYQQRGYLAANVSAPVQKLDSARRTGRIVVPVVEGPAFHVGELQFSGNRALSAGELQAGVPLEAGAVFEPARLHPTVAALKQKYGKLGYRETQVVFSVTRHDDAAQVDVMFTVVENQQTSISAVKIEGTHHTSEEFARSRLRLGKGQVANAELISDSVKSLSQTGAYTSADVEVRPLPEAGANDKPVRVADLVVALQEPKPFRLLYGGLYDSGGGPGFIADFRNHNFLGAGQTLGLRTRVDSETDEARLYMTRPFWGQEHISTTVATYFTRKLEYKQTVPTETMGISLQQDVQLRSKWLLSYGYRYERQRGFVPDPAAPDIPATLVSVAPLSLTFSRDARDSFLDATHGSFISNGFELAPHFLGSDYPYARYYVQYFKYFPLTRPRPVPYGEKPQRSRLIFATGSRLGLQKGFSEGGAVLTDRFFAGGGTTVRGFHQDELGPRLANGEPAGGNAVLVLNEELRYPLFWIFDAVTFVDAGNVYPRVSDFRLSQLRAASGFGLRIRNPFVVLRFDYGLKLGRRPGESLGAFFFSIGQAF